MGNETIYSVGKDFGKANELFAKQTVSQVGLSREILAKLTAWHDFSAFNHVLHMWLFHRLLLASYS